MVLASAKAFYTTRFTSAPPNRGAFFGGMESQIAPLYFTLTRQTVTSRKCAGLIHNICWSSILLAINPGARLLNLNPYLYPTRRFRFHRRQCGVNLMASNLRFERIAELRLHTSTKRTVAAGGLGSDGGLSLRLGPSRAAVEPKAGSDAAKLRAC
jgi:hypothetical protein